MALRSLAKLGAIFILIFLVGGCATEDPATRDIRKKRRDPGQRKWYQSDMENEDRTFFIDSFFKSG